MREEYEKLIANFDRTLGILREQWMEAKGKDVAKYAERLNAALDERLRLMKLRDAEVDDSEL